MQWGGLYPYGGIPLFDWGVSCSLNREFNTGAAWGLFPGHPGLLFAVRFLIILFLVGYLVLRKEKSFFPWLIIVGAVGNAIDYCVYGHVIDFIHVTFWKRSFPIFNLADSYITIGALLLFFTPKKIHDSRLESLK
jgi:signal peptidase II